LQDHEVAVLGNNAERYYPKVNLGVADRREQLVELLVPDLRAADLKAQRGLAD
jgi:hypothetical protein